METCQDYRSGDELAENAGAKAAGQTDDGETGKVSDETTGNTQVYILNRNTKKFHLPDCGSAADIKEENRAEFSGSREELLEAGYTSCGRCNP